jgi:hypothetical protein
MVLITLARNVIDAINSQLVESRIDWHVESAKAVEVRKSTKAYSYHYRD